MHKAAAIILALVQLAFPLFLTGRDIQREKERELYSKPIKIRISEYSISETPTSEGVIEEDNIYGSIDLILRFNTQDEYYYIYDEPFLDVDVDSEGFAVFTPSENKPDGDYINVRKFGIDSYFDIEKSKTFNLCNYTDEDFWWWVNVNLDNTVTVNGVTHTVYAEALLYDGELTITALNVDGESVPLIRAITVLL